MDKVITATGKEFDTNYLVTIPRPAMLFVRIYNSNIETVREVFSNPGETIRLEYSNKQFDGYTKLDTIVDEGNALKVVLEQNG